MTQLIASTDYVSNLGTVKLSANRSGITCIIFKDKETPKQRSLAGESITKLLKSKPNSSELNSINDILTQTSQQLQEYFSGKRQQFNVPLSTFGTPFQEQVWQQLQRIPYGQQCSYKDIATAINNPKANQAVGGANGKNPISIIVPCHRVVGQNGKLVGYAGGVERKQALLALEAQHR